MASSKDSGLIKPASFGEDEPSTTALATVEDDDLTQGFARPQMNSSTEDFDDEDIQLLRLRIIQSGSPEAKAKPPLAEVGDFIVTGFPAMKRVTIVPCLKGRMRMATVGEGNARAIACSSIDCKVGTANPIYVQEMTIKPTGKCATCPLAEWRENPRNPQKNLPPLCDTIAILYCYVPQIGMMVDFRLKKTQLGLSKQINNIAFARGFGHFAIEVYNTVEKNDKGDFCVPHMVMLDDVSPAVLKRARFISGIDKDEHDEAEGSVDDLEAELAL